MANYFENPPPYSTNPPPQSQHFAPPYYDDYGRPLSSHAGYNAVTVPPPQPAAARATPAAAPAPAAGGRSAAARAPQQQPKRGQKKQQQPRQQQQQQARPKIQRANSAPSEISLCTKYSLFFANFIFWLAGVGLIAIGIWAWLDRGVFSNVDQLVTSWYLDPVLWFLVMGGIIFFMATFGCIGALRENICLLKTYSTVLGLMLLIEAGGGVAIYFYRDTIERFVTSRLDDIAIAGYRDNVDFQDIVDGLQTGLQCCGVNDYNDWDMNLYFNCSASGRYNPEACGVPFSCCIRDPAEQSDVVNTQCGYGVRSGPESEISQKIYTRGCIVAFKSWLSTNLVVVAVGAGAILLVQIFGFCFATSLTSDIRRQMSRWRRR